GGAAVCEGCWSGGRGRGENLSGEEGLGWGMAKLRLASERVSVAKGGLIWGNGPTVHDLVSLVRDNGGVADRVSRQRLVDVWIEGEILRFHHLRQISAAVNKKPGPDASLRKALTDPNGQRVYRLAVELLGAAGMLDQHAVGEAWEEW